MTGIMKKVTEFYKKDECSKYYKLGKTLGTYVTLSAREGCCAVLATWKLKICSLCLFFQWKLRNCEERYQ